MTARPPLDPHREAFARGLGHLLAETIWQEVLRAGPRNESEGAELAPRKDGARRLAGSDADAVEVDDGKMHDTAA